MPQIIVRAYTRDVKVGGGDPRRARGSHGTAQACGPRPAKSQRASGSGALTRRIAKQRRPRTWRLTAAEGPR
jgi:hypothetical protein